MTDKSVPPLDMWLERVLKAVQIVALVAVPLTVVWWQNQTATALHKLQVASAESLLKGQYVQLAMQVLKEKIPTDPNERTSAIPLRCLAVRILAENSPTPISKQQRTDLMSWGVGGSFGSGFARGSFSSNAFDMGNKEQFSCEE